jgi:UDP-glucuronate 4-epimerase
MTPRGARSGDRGPVQGTMPGAVRPAPGGRVVVTGGAGFVGWHVVQRLLQSGARVLAVDDFDPFYDRAQKIEGLAHHWGHPAFEFADLDVRHRSRFESLLDHADSLIHLAARAGVRPSLADPETYRSINVGGTRAVLAAARARGVSRVVFASSSSVYGQGVVPPFREEAALGAALSPYAITKRDGEALCGDYAAGGFGRVAVVRLFSVYGPRQRPDLALHAFARRMARDEPIPQLGEGATTRDYTHVQDAAQGILAALAWTGAGRPGREVFNIGSGRPVRLDSLIAKLAKAMGRTPRIERRPEHPADLACTWADIGKARAVLSYTPRVELDAGIADFVTWFEETYGRQSSTAA